MLGDTSELSNSPEVITIDANTDTEDTEGPLDFFRSVEIFFDPHPDDEHIQISIQTSFNQFVSLWLDRINGRLVAQADIPEILSRSSYIAWKDGTLNWMPR